MFGVIPRLYNGLYATPGPLLAAPPVLLGCSWRTRRLEPSKAPESRRSRPEPEAPSAVRAVQRGAPEPPFWRPPNEQAFALNFGLGLYFKTMGLYAGIVPHKPEYNP